MEDVELDIQRSANPVRVQSKGLELEDVRELDVDFERRAGRVGVVIEVTQVDVSSGD